MDLKKLNLVCGARQNAFSSEEKEAPDNDN
jgi:hypothetical protein